MGGWGSPPPAGEEISLSKVRIEKRMRQVGGPQKRMRV
jgi:hypothetical protein